MSSKKSEKPEDKKDKSAMTEISSIEEDLKKLSQM